jgi:acetyltransferase-like isoleucine patch superfamily enzyme
MTLKSIYRRLCSEIYIIINCHRFGSIGTNCRIYSPLKINGKKGIFIGSGVIVEYKAWLTANSIEKGIEARLEIGDGTVLGHFNHIYATKGIKIGNNVLTADRVYISDNLHSYEDINLPVLHQPIKQIAEVEIGDGTWIGEGVCIIGAKIGRGCVIGANAVVTKDIPDYSVAVGIPAKIIKQYNYKSKQWEKID